MVRFGERRDAVVAEPGSAAHDDVAVLEPQAYGPIALFRAAEEEVAGAPSDTDTIGRAQSRSSLVQRHARRAG